VAGLAGLPRRVRRHGRRAANTQFNRYQRQGILLAGVGGRMLETVADFQRTPVMIKLAVDDNGLVSRWTLTVWRFSGDRLVATQTKSGRGSDAPSSAYR
jgi:hypothetical protein